MRAISTCWCNVRGPVANWGTAKERKEVKTDNKGERQAVTHTFSQSITAKEAMLEIYVTEPKVRHSHTYHIVRHRMQKPLKGGKKKNIL